MEIPNYKTMPLFNDKKKVYNVAHIKIQTTVLMPRNTDLTWNSLIEDHNGHNSMLDSNNVIDNLPGTMRDRAVGNN